MTREAGEFTDIWGMSLASRLTGDQVYYNETVNI